MVSEGWMYLPTIGLFLGVAQTLAVWLNSPTFKGAPIIAAAAVAIAALLFGMKTYSQNETYRNPVTFYENIIHSDGNRSRAYPNLGLYYLDEGDFDTAVKFLQSALENPGEPDRPIGQLSEATLHVQLALAYLRISLDEDDQVAPDAVIKALSYSTQIPEAIDELNKALKLNPHFVLAHTLLRTIYSWQESQKGEVK